MQLDIIIAEWNANGMSNHLNEIETFLNLNNIDIFLVSETHLTSRSFLRIKGYDFIISNHPDDRAHGGAAILIKTSLKYETLDAISESFLQAAGIKLLLENGSSIAIYSVYFPPRFSISCSMYEHFFGQIGSKFIVGGDFNAKHVWWGSRLNNPKGKQLYECINKNNYQTISTGKPTYWPSDLYKIPDLLDFFVYCGVSPQYLDISVCDDLSSDHTPILLNYRAIPCQRLSEKPLFSYKTNLERYQNYINSELNLKISLKTDTEIDDALENFVKLIHEAAYQATPLEENNKKSSVQITLEIKKLIKEKRRLRKLWQTTRRSSDKTNFNRAAQYLSLIHI